MDTEPIRFSPVQPVRAYQRVVEQIEQAVTRGDLRPGHRLPSERELVDQFSVSRPTVREALRVLESDGLVRSRPGDPRGPEVLGFTAGGLHKQFARLASVDGMGLCELIGFRMILEGSANQLAARLATASEIAEMEAAHQRMGRAIEEGQDRFSEADMAFHDTVARASKNVLIKVCSEVVRGVVLSLIADKIERAPDQQGLMAESLRHHGEVLAQVRSGDGAAAARTARRNLYDYYAGYVPEPERAPLRALLDDTHST